MNKLLTLLSIKHNSYLDGFILTSLGVAMGREDWGVFWILAIVGSILSVLLDKYYGDEA